MSGRHIPWGSRSAVWQIPRAGGDQRAVDGAHPATFSPSQAPVQAVGDRTPAQGLLFGSDRAQADQVIRRSNRRQSRPMAERSKGGNPASADVTTLQAETKP